MLNLIKFELLKILQKRNLIAFLIILCFINVGIFAYTQNLDSNIPPSAYQQLQTDLQTISNDKRYQFIKDKYETYHGFLIIEQLAHLRIDEKQNQYMIDSVLADNPGVEEKYGKFYQDNHEPHYTSHLESEVTFLESVLKEFQQLSDYPAYIQNIQDKADTISHISIFQKEDSFEQRNIKKTAQDYQVLVNTPLTYESGKGISSALSFPITSFLIILSMMVLASTMILEEKEKKLFSIMKITPKGQYPTLLAKCVVMIVSVGIITTVMMLSQLFYASIIYGGGDLLRSIQSLADYYQCPFPINVQQFIILFILIKWIAASCIGLIMLLITILAKHKILAIGSSIMLIIIEYILYLFIPSLNSLYLLKYFNLISVLQTDAFFQIYRNVSFFGILISLQMLILIGLFILFALFIIINTFVYHYKCNMSIETAQFLHLKYSLTPSLSLMKQECYKLFSIQKVLILCILCIGIQCYQYQHVSIYMDNNEKIYQQYMQKLEGPLTDEKEQWILQEQKHYQVLNQQLEAIAQKQQQGLITKMQANAMQEQIEQQKQGEEIFQKIFEQYQDILIHPQKQFVMPLAYQQFFIETTWTFMPTILLCLFVIVALSQFMTYEYQNQMNKITQVTYYGHQYIVRIKCLLSLIVGFIFFIIIMIPPIILLHKVYGFSSFYASVTSIPDLAMLPAWLNMIMFCILNFILRFFALSCICIGILALGIKMKNHLLTLFISLCIFLVPLLLAYGGYHFLDVFSLYPLLLSGQFLSTSQELLQILFSLIGYGCLFVIAWRYIQSNYKYIR